MEKLISKREEAAIMEQSWLTKGSRMNSFSETVGMFFIDQQPSMVLMSFEGFGRYIRSPETD